VAGVVANVAINVDSRGAVSKLREVQQGAQATQRATADLTTALAKQSGAFSKLQAGAAGAVRSLSGLRGALASIGAGALVAGMVRGAAAAEQLQLRLKLLSREYGETERVQQFVAQSAKTFGQSQVEAATGVADVYARLRPLGTSLAQIETVYKGFNAVALASGASAQAASGAFLQLSQALGSGRLQGDEFRSIAEQVPGILKLVANEMGVTVGQLKQLGSEGKITSDILINALAKGFEENKDKISELLALSPAQRFKEFKDSTQALSNAMGSELLPAIVPVVKVATELLKLFGQLPGPMKTIIAAAFGLTAAFVALAPAISLTISLLGGLSIATLAAAGPWIALAAGIGVAISALASYRSEAEKVGGAARGGGAANVAAASKLLAKKDAQIAGLQGQQQTAGGRQRGSIDRNLAVLRRERSQLQSAVQAGTAATPAAAAANAMGTPVGSTVGGGRGAGGGGDAKRAADEAARAAEEIRQQVKAADDLNFTLKNRLAIAQTTEPVAKRMLEYDIRQNEIAKEYDELKQAAKSADELILINANQVIEQRIAQIEAEQQINDLLAERALLMADVMRQASMPTVYNELETQEAALQAVLDKYPAIGAAADAAATMATSGISEMIAGTKSAEQVFIEFLNAIADALINTAKQMIAQYIAIGIAKMFAGLGGGGGGGGGFAPSGPLAAVGNVGPAMNFNPVGANPVGAFAFAEGGFVTGPTSAMIGEGGESEYVIPASKMQSAMSRYSRGARGEGVIAGSGGGSEGGAATAAAGPMVVDVRYSVERINDVEYVTASQFQAGMRQAAQQGATQGEKRALRQLQQNTSIRGRVGLR
jgi:tape measure domain-containing protein